MINNYTFNDVRKRFENSDPICAYCSVNKVRTPDEHHFVSVFKEVDRTDIVVYKSVKYQEVAIGIPRCTNCYVIHDAAGDKANLYCWGAAIFISLLSGMIWGLLGIFIALVCLCLAW